MQQPRKPSRRQMQRLNQSKFDKNRIWRKNSEKWSEKPVKSFGAKQASAASLGCLLSIETEEFSSSFWEDLRGQPLQPQKATILTLTGLRSHTFKARHDWSTTFWSTTRTFSTSKTQYSIWRIFFSSLNLEPKNHFSDSLGSPRTFFVLVTG